MPRERVNEFLLFHYARKVSIPEKTDLLISCPPRERVNFGERIHFYTSKVEFG